MSDPEFLDVHGSNLRRLRDLNPTSTVSSLIVDVSETALTSLACNPELGERIQKLNVRSCRLNSLIGLSHLENLEELNIGLNQLKTVSSDREDCKAPLLTKLIADNNEISDIVPNPNMASLSFAGFPNLVYLDLSYNSIEKLGFASTLSPQLRYLNISHNKIDDLCEFNHLLNLSDLEEIEFEGNPCNQFLNDYKLLVLIKAIIVGKLAVVNKVKINERDELCAESLHVAGIRKFKPENSTHDDLVKFVKEKLGKINNKELDTLFSQQQKNSARRESIFSVTNRQSTFEGATPKTSKVPRKNTKIRRSISLTSVNPLRSLPRVVEERVCNSTSIELPQSNTESNSQAITSKMLDEFQRKFEQLFSMCKTYESEIAKLKVENTKLREYIVKQDQDLHAINDQLSIVPTKMKVYQRKKDNDSQFILEWENQLKALQNVECYELQLGESSSFRLLAPNRRVVMENPVEGQKIVLKAIHKNNGKASEGQEFIFKQPNNAENKENL